MDSGAKNLNAALSSKRVKIEHVFAELKRFRMLKDGCRLLKEDSQDLVFKIACGLYNRSIARKAEAAKRQHPTNTNDS